MTEREAQARQEFSASLESNRSEVQGRREAVREQSGRAVAPQRLKFLRDMAAAQRRRRTA